VKGGRYDGWVDDETRVCRFGYEGLVIETLSFACFGVR